MKKQLLVLIAFFLTTQLSFSQDTLANMLEVGNKWNRSLQVDRMAGVELVDKITKDTIIGNKKFVICEEEVTRNTNVYYFRFRRFILRQEGNKVIYFTGNGVFTAYEFSGLNKGDSIICNVDSLIKYMGYTFYSLYPTLKIQKIDTLFFNNRQLRRFELIPNNEIIGNYFFEGIGFSLAGPLIPKHAEQVDLIIGRKLRCFKNKNNTFTYVMGDMFKSDLLDINNKDYFCDILSNVTDETELSSLSLSKTSENQIQLSSSINLSNAQLTLYDMKGSAFAANLQQDNTIDVSNLQAGLYVLRLQTADQKMASFKFMK